MKVTALLVSHSGGRWLPAVLAGLERSTRLPDEIVRVDTGSTDDSAALLEQAFGPQGLAVGAAVDPAQVHFAAMLGYVPVPAAAAGYAPAADGKTVKPPRP